jgi:hypothetical protein
VKLAKTNLQHATVAMALALMAYCSQQGDVDAEMLLHAL